MTNIDKKTTAQRKNEFDVVLANLGRVVSFCKRNSLSLIGGALLGAILGLVLTFIVTAEWESSSLIRIGQLGNVGSAGTPIEPPMVTVDRIKSKPFQNEVLLSLGLSVSDEDEKVKNFRKSLKVKLEKSELINVTVRAPTQETAKQYMGAVISQLKVFHTAMSLPTVSRWHQELQSVENDLKLTSSESQQITGLLGKREIIQDAKNFSQAVVLNNTLISREKELQNLGDRKRQLEERLSPERTFETNALGGIEISEKPVFPKKSIFAIAGVVFGLCMSLIWINRRAV